jgi:hypothetical protein
MRDFVVTVVSFFFFGQESGPCSKELLGSSGFDLRFSKTSAARPILSSSTRDALDYRKEQFSQLR